MTWDITVAIPSCNRPRLLARTLDGLVPHVHRHRLAVLIGENIEVSAEIEAVVGSFRERCPGASVELMDLCNAVSSESPTARMLAAVDLIYDRIDTPYVFHCEDDWWLSRYDFLSPSRAILEQRPEVKIVRLTGEEVRPLPEGEKSHEVRFPPSGTARYRLSRYGGGGGLFGAFTFNPGLRRLGDWREHFGSYGRFATEAEISQFAQRLGHREAILEDVYARHMGVGWTTQRVTRPGEGAGRKVFCIGMFKTGTTSFGEAMQLLGYRSRYRFIPLLDRLDEYFDLNPRQFDRFEPVIRQEAESFDAFADAPWLYLYRRLSQWYPDSLFVLTLRSDAETVARSDLEHWERHGLMDRWMGEVGTPPTVDMFVERYERHNEGVLNFFRGRSHRLLQVCWEREREPWRRLCDFVAADVPGDAFPHANRSPRRG